MTARLIDGNVVAENIKAEIQERIQGFGVGRVCLAAVQVGENAASGVYVRNQREACENLGIRYGLHELPADTGQEGLTEFIGGLNADRAVDGIILQLPLPKGLDANAAADAIAPEKDVEGVTAGNLGRLLAGRDALVPCTAQAAYECFLASGLDPKGVEAVIVGRSVIVGKPLGLLLMANHATVTTCHTRTRDMAFHTKRADALFVAAGVAGMLKAEMVKPGAVVIDVGINRVPVLDGAGRPVTDKKGRPKKKTVGDVDFDAVREVAGAITPVPGGCGAVTTAILLRNTVLAHRRRSGR